MNVNRNTMNAITRLIIEGLPPEDACNIFDVGPKEYKRLMKEDLDFAKEISVAESKAKVALLRTLRGGSKRNPSIAGWILERRWNQQFGANKEQEMKGQLEELIFAFRRGPVPVGESVAKEITPGNGKEIQEKTIKEIPAGNVIDVTPIEVPIEKKEEVKKN
jgi:hypothetical protein